MVRRSRNEPFLTLSIEQIKGLIEQFPSEKLILAGFSQGACLTADLLVRHGQKVAGAWLFSGGLIGHDDEMPELGESLEGLPVCLSGSSQDPHIPAQRMSFTADHLKSMGADVETLHYDLATHQIAAEELELARKTLAKIRARVKV